MMSVLLLCLAAGSFLLVSAQQLPEQRDPLVPLKRALNEAGAPPLTSQQEDQLKHLVLAFQMARRPEGPNTTVPAARRAYDEAIVAGDTAAAQAQAAIIADQRSANVKTNLQAEANFKIQVLKILSEDQVTALLHRAGTAGVSRILSALTGGEGPFPGRERPMLP
jgi:hypothetical protein